MPDQPYSNRELDAMFKTLNDKSEERHKDVMKELIEIKQQTTKTNGRVSKLEAWRSWMVGAGAIILLFAKYVKNLI